MPFVFIRSNAARSLIQETKERAREEISGMSLDLLEAHLAEKKKEYEALKKMEDDKSKVVYHELAVIKSEYTRKVNARNAILAKKYLKLKAVAKLKCSHCGKLVQFDTM